MDPQLAARLTDINRQFYRRSWRRFVDRRRRPWAGWARVLDTVGALHRDATALDVGCGHGRFAAWLAEVGYEGTSLGLDSSPPLVVCARARRIARARFVCSELTRALGGRERFDLVTAFGLLHHLPGRRLRRRVVADLCAQVRGGGHLVITLWQPDAKRRARGRPVDGGEPGDVILPWGEGEDAADRYCHFFDAAEADAIENHLAVAGAVVRFRADGRGGENLYLVGRRGSAGTAGRPVQTVE